MKRTVHAYIGMALGFLIAGSNYYVLPYTASFGWLGGWFPDLDLRHKHRKGLHNFIATIVFTSFVYVGSYALYKEFMLLAEEVPLYISLAFVGGYILHLFFDSLTPRGVYILYPLSNKKLRIASFKSNGLFINGLGFLIASMIIAYWLIKYMGSSLYLKIIVHILNKTIDYFFPAIARIIII